MRPRPLCPTCQTSNGISFIPVRDENGVPSSAFLELCHDHRLPPRFYAARNIDGKLSWLYARDGLVPAGALYITGSLIEIEAWITHTEVVERERADADKRAAAQKEMF